MNSFKLLATLILIFGVSNLSKSQNLFEASDSNLSYNLKNSRILIITYDNCSYEETILMSDKWKEWGATIEIAANAYQIKATKVTMNNNKLEDSGVVDIKANYLINQISPEKYDVIYIVGGDNFRLLVDQYGNEMKKILSSAYQQKKIISAFCHSPALLSICDFIKGKSVVVEGKPERQMLLDAGAVVRNEIIMKDGNIITGRFPYSETFINVVAESIQYPQGDGPWANLQKKKNPMLSFIENTANAQLFSKEKISSDILVKIMNVGFKSVISEFFGYNKSLKFVCLQDSEVIGKIRQLLIAKNTESFSNRPDPNLAANRYFTGMLENTSAIIFSYNDNKEVNAIANLNKKEQMKMKMISYNGASCQNMLLAARALCVGAKLSDIKWFNVIEPELSTLFKLPENYKLVNVMLFGYSDFDFVPTVTRPSGDYIIFK